MQIYKISDPMMSLFAFTRFGVHKNKNVDVNFTFNVNINILSIFQKFN